MNLQTHYDLKKWQGVILTQKTSNASRLGALLKAAQAIFVRRVESPRRMFGLGVCFRKPRKHK